MEERKADALKKLQEDEAPLSAQIVRETNKKVRHSCNVRRNRADLAERTVGSKPRYSANSKRSNRAGNTNATRTRKDRCGYR